MEARRNSRQQVTRHSRRLAPPGFGQAGLFLRANVQGSSLRASNPIAYTWHDGAGRKIITMTPEFLGIRGCIHFVLSLISFYFGKAAVVAKSTMSLLCPRTSI